MRLELECLYCGHKWEKTAYNKQSIESEICSVCKDSNLKVRDLSVAKIDQYKGCPPFPEKEKANDSDPFWMYNGSYIPGSVD